ncbi:hypothetical protein K491DRAFT_693238 [Lophiostoma macrostomum CBS 122681]|uniref:Protein kinase domain-containing protein n=1 Tax=Lophiostoma macrostomum CBS 122681 TaxID=1314788 RepID=A0A6A6T7A5_9PLEO|nr:hypothetical protein K491DRAFT_693238 [Lophiostoma macrostomum CBS 122681]
MYERVQDSRNLDETLGRYRQLGLAIHDKNSYLYAHLDALHMASRNSAIPPNLKDELDASLERCKQSQDRAIKELEKYDPSRTFAKWAYGFAGKDSLRKKYDRFESDLNQVEKLCFRMNLVQQNSSNLLRPDYFKLVHETAESQPGETLPISDIWVAAGNYSDTGTRHDGDYVVEKKYVENDVRSLCDILRRASVPTPGILPCLGYRQPLYNDQSPPYRSFLQLIMELPADTDRQSLAYRLDTEAAPTLPDRLALAKDLVSAVNNVHRLKLVHKSIRSRAILLTTDRKPESSYHIFLQDWTYVRTQTAATSQNGGEDAWQTRIYQHPERQHTADQWPEVAYEPKHDIYSLGVVLMEILLWTPFVERCDSANLHAELRVATLYQDTVLGMGEEIMPSRYKGNSQKLTRFPMVIRDVWTSIARNDVTRVNAELGDVVVACLEGGYASAQEVLEALSRVDVS